MKGRAWTVGVDFGGTNIKVGVVTSRGTVAAKVVLPTRNHTTPSTFLDGVACAIERLASTLGLRLTSLQGLGVGAPGLIDGQHGIIHRLVNIPGGWPRVPLRQLLERRFPCPCAVDNDVNVIALGEWTFGAGRGTRHSVYVTLGTGVGGGLVIDGKLVRGASGSAGEIGHITIQPDGPTCACGNRGCLEALVGTAAILRRARQMIRTHKGGALATFANRKDGPLSPELVSRAARVGDRAAREIWQEVGSYVGLGLSKVITLLNPERIVIGGGVAKAWPWFAPSLLKTIRAHALEVPARACRVVQATLGDRAGIIGGAVLVWEQVKG